MVRAAFRRNRYKRDDSDFLDFRATCTGNCYAATHICTAIPNKQPRIWHPLLAAPRRPPRTGRPTSPPAPQGQPLQANNATKDAHACLFSSSADLLVRPPLEDDRDAPLCAPSNLSQLGSHKFRSKSNAEQARNPNRHTLKSACKVFRPLLSLDNFCIQLHICFPHRTKSNTEITSLHCERSNKTEWHLSPRGDLGIFYYFIIIRHINI